MKINFKRVCDKNSINWILPIQGVTAGRDLEKVGRDPENSN